MTQSTDSCKKYLDDRSASPVKVNLGLCFALCVVHFKHTSINGWTNIKIQPLEKLDVLAVMGRFKGISQGLNLNQSNDWIAENERLLQSYKLTLIYSDKKKKESG